MSMILSDADAEVVIRRVLDEFKCADHFKVGLLDLIVKTNLPSEQIERVMSSLESEGVRIMMYDEASQKGVSFESMWKLLSSVFGVRERRVR